LFGRICPTPCAEYWKTLFSIGRASAYLELSTPLLFCFSQMAPIHCHAGQRELVLVVSEARVGEYGVGSAKENSARREEGVAG